MSEVVNPGVDGKMCIDKWRKGLEKKIDELDYKTKFESMLEANQNRGRKGKRVVKYLDENYKS